MSLLWRGRLSWAIRGNGEQRKEEKKLDHCHLPTQHPHRARLSLSEKNGWTTPASRRKVVLHKLDQVLPTIYWDDNKAGHRKRASQSDKSCCTRSVPAGGWMCTLVHCLTCRPVSCSKQTAWEKNILLLWQQFSHYLGREYLWVMRWKANSFVDVLVNNQWCKFWKYIFSQRKFHIRISFSRLDGTKNEKVDNWHKRSTTGRTGGKMEITPASSWVPSSQLAAVYPASEARLSHHRLCRAPFLAPGSPTWWAPSSPLPVPCLWSVQHCRSEPHSGLLHPCEMLR